MRKRGDRGDPGKKVYPGCPGLVRISANNDDAGDQRENPNRQDFPKIPKLILRRSTKMYDRISGRKLEMVGQKASFDGPARSIHCALELVEVLQNFNAPAQIGVHTGEVELMNDKVRGIAVDIAVRIALLPKAGEVFVSRTMKDLTAGSGIVFEDCGVHEVGTTEAWRVYRVATYTAP